MEFFYFSFFFFFPHPTQYNDTVELASLKRNLNEERVSFSILFQRNACLKKVHRTRGRFHHGLLPSEAYQSLLIVLLPLSRASSSCQQYTVFVSRAYAEAMCALFRARDGWYNAALCTMVDPRSRVISGSEGAAYGTCWRCHVIDDTFGFFYDFLEGALFRFLPLVLAHRNLDSHFLSQPLEDRASSSGFNWWEQPNTRSLLLLKVGHQTRLWLSTEMKSTTTQSTWYQVHLFAAFIWAPTKTVNCFGSYTLFRASPKSLQALWF